MKCNLCSKPTLEAGFQLHLENCKKIKQREKKQGQKRKKAAEKSGEPSGESKRSNSKKLKLAKAPLPIGNFVKHLNLLDLDKQCGVIAENGVQCLRSITCKIHTVNAKRLVPGRSMQYGVSLP